MLASSRVPYLLDDLLLIGMYPRQRSYIWVHANSEGNFFCHIYSTTLLLIVFSTRREKPRVVLFPWSEWHSGLLQASYRKFQWCWRCDFSVNVYSTFFFIWSIKQLVLSFGQKIRLWARRDFLVYGADSELNFLVNTFVVSLLIRKAHCCSWLIVLASAFRGMICNLDKQKHASLRHWWTEIHWYWRQTNAFFIVCIKYYWE